MRQFLALAAVLSLAAGAAHAQFQPIEPIRAPTNPYALPQAPHPQAFKPYTPPEPFKPYTGQSVYQDGPFSPAGEARRERRANKPPAGGPFSPEAEAKRERERAKGFHPF